jgi:hypothetical protein
MFPQTPHIECVALLEKVRPTPPREPAGSAASESDANAAEPSLGVAAAEGTAAADSGA